MSSTLLEIPAEPLPNKQLATANIHKLSRKSPDELVLEPGQTDWWAALISIGFLPLVFGLCALKQASQGLTVSLCLIPVFAAGGFALAAWYYDRFGTRAHFDRKHRSVRVTGRQHGEGLSYPFEGIKAVQFCDRRGRLGPSGRVCQVNLVVGSDPHWRINLLSSGGRKQLRRIAGEIAEFLDVPVYVNALAAPEGPPGEPGKSEVRPDTP